MVSQERVSSSFFEEEIRGGYTITPEMKKIWAVELELLDEFDRVCKQLNIKYFLDSGTLLGAVRDGHFIPWDDDIDLIMLRKDYDILVQDRGKSFQKEYFFQCAYTDTDYPRGHAQLRKKGTCAMIPVEAEHVKFDQGIFMDIFVLDGIAPDPEKLAEQFKRKNRIHRKINTLCNPFSDSKVKTMVKHVLCVPYRFVYKDVKALFAKYEEICKEYKDTGYVDKIMFRRDSSKVIYLKKEWFSDSVNIPFEGREYPVPGHYKDVLEAYYGKDFMTPMEAPSMHGGLIIDVEKSYKEVLEENHKR